MTQFVVRKQVLVLGLLTVVGSVSADKIDEELLGLDATDRLHVDYPVWRNLWENLFSQQSGSPGHLREAISSAASDFKKLMLVGKAQSRVTDSVIHLMSDTVVIPAMEFGERPIPREVVSKLIEDLRDLFRPYVFKRPMEPYDSVDHPKTAALIQSLSGSEDVPYDLIEAFRQEYKQILQLWLETGEKGGSGDNRRQELVKCANYMSMKDVKALKKLVLLDGELVRDGAVSDKLRTFYLRELPLVS